MSIKCLHLILLLHTNVSSLTIELQLTFFTACAKVLGPRLQLLLSILVSRVEADVRGLILDIY
jgi:hypothetical protein